MRICILLTTLLMLVAAHALPNLLDAQESRESPPQEWADNFDARFLPRQPTIGDAAPEVGGFDEEGYLYLGDQRALEGLRSLAIDGWSSDLLGAAIAILVVGVLSMSMCLAALRGRVRAG